MGGEKNPRMGGSKPASPIFFMKKQCSHCKKWKREKDFYLYKSVCKPCRIACQKILNAKYKERQKLPPLVQEMMEKYNLTKLPTENQLKDFAAWRNL